MTKINWKKNLQTYKFDGGISDSVYWEVVDLIREALSSQLSDLKEEIKGMKVEKHANIKPMVDIGTDSDSEWWGIDISWTEAQIYNQAISNILSLLDKKVGGKK